MRRTIHIWLILLLICAGACLEVSANMSIQMSKKQLIDKIKGGWAGKTIGCTYGGPVEFIYLGKTIPEQTSIIWNKDRVRHYFDSFPGLYDDVYVDISFVETIRDLGFEAPADSFAIRFANAPFPLWHANQMARYNIKRGIMPPLSGCWLNNPHADDIDYQIEADFAGLLHPAMVNEACDLSDKVGHIFTYGDGWYGGVFVGALFSLAFVYNDVEELIENALQTIPSKSDFFGCIFDVVRFYRQYPNDWRKTWDMIEKRWGNEVGCPDGVFQPFNIDAKINCAYVVMGLLYGEKDFYKTIDIAARCGQDADCNPSTAAGVLGTMLGYSHIPDYWKSGLKQVEHVPFACTPISLEKIYELNYELVLKRIAQMGGNIDNKHVVIPFERPVSVRYEKSFDGHYPKEKINIGQSLKNDIQYIFDGIGIVQKGYVQCSDINYEARVEAYMDGRMIEEIILPVGNNTCTDNRRVDLFYCYQLPKGKHTVSFHWINPREDAQIYFGESVIYTDCPMLAASNQ